MAVKVIGFISAWDRDEHFAEHDAEFGGKYGDALEYEAGAAAFFNRSLVGSMHRLVDNISYFRRRCGE